MGNYPFTVPVGDVVSVFGRTGIVTAQAGDYTPAQVGASPALQLIYADELPGVDPTGAADSSAAVRAEQTALGAVPYVLVFGAGTYKMNSAFVNLGLQQYIEGQGQFATSFTWSGAGPLVTVVEPGAFNGGHRAGRLSGFSIAGPFGSGGTAGIKYGALQSFQIDDVGFFGLDGGAILGYKSGSVDYAEEAIMTRMNVSECGATSGYVFQFTGTSFDYSLIDAVVVVEANIDIVSVTGGAQLQGLDLGLRGNVHGGGSNTGAVIAIERGNGGGTGYLTNAHFAVTMEADNAGAGTVGPYLLWMGSGNSTSQFSADGVFNIFNAGATPQGGPGVGNTGNANFLPAAFDGITLDPSGGSMTPGDALVIAGSTCWAPSNASNFGTPFQGNVFWQFGDVASLTLVNGVNTLVFNGANGFIRRTEMLIRQPASGAAGTVTWPASVKWAAGVAPTLSIVNGYVDKLRFTYIPNTGFWYGTSDGLHYS